MSYHILIVEPSEIIVKGLVTILSTNNRFIDIETLPNINHLEERLIISDANVLIINPTLFNYDASIVSSFKEKRSLVTIALIYQYVEPSVISQFDITLDINSSPNSIFEIIENAMRQKENDERAANENVDLTEREIDVLILVAKGLSSREIADQLCISFHTVISHRKNITKKTGIKSVAGLAVYAMLNNLISPSDINEL